MQLYYTNDILEVEQRLKLNLVSHMLVKNGNLKTVSGCLIFPQQSKLKAHILECLMTC